MPVETTIGMPVRAMWVSSAWLVRSAEATLSAGTPYAASWSTLGGSQAVHMTSMPTSRQWSKTSKSWSAARLNRDSRSRVYCGPRSSPALEPDDWR